MITSHACRVPSYVVFALAGALAIASAGDAASAQFDFPRLLACRDVITEELAKAYPECRIVESVLQVSVRFEGDDANEIEEITLDVSALSPDMRVHNFSPSTELGSDLTKEITEQTRTETSRSLDATLGGGLPVPYGDVVAHVTPSINGGIGRHESTTKTITRLPPLRPLVVSGTTNQGRGAFFKLKKSSQTTLEGVHELTVRWVVPEEWQGDRLRVSCVAMGRRKVLWVEQPKVLGRLATTVVAYPQGEEEARLSAQASLRSVAEERQCCKPLLQLSDLEAGRQQLEEAVSKISGAAGF